MFLIGGLIASAIFGARYDEDILIPMLGMMRGRHPRPIDDLQNLVAAARLRVTSPGSGR